MNGEQRTVYLIRHGATEANLARPYTLQGQGIDLPLGAIGRRQAEAAARTLAERSIAGFFSSPLRRAIETSEIIAAPHGRPVTAVPELIECDVGRWEGMSWEAIRRQDPRACADFEADPAGCPYAGGESFGDVARRVLPALRRLLDEHPRGDVAVITHNIVARVWVADLAGLPLGQARSIRLDNGGISVVSVAPDRATLVTLNSVLHLNGLVFD
jgi:broad specificity phosphatase PhoE